MSKAITRLQFANILALTLAAALTYGCATPYSHVGLTGGFDERQLSRNEFFVAFSGNGYTTGQRAIDLCLMRCAELTLGHGFRYFQLTANSAGFDTSSSVTVGNFVPTGYGGGVFISNTQTIPKPSASNRILCFRKKPGGTTEYFDAQSVFDELSQKYGVHKNVDTFPEFRLPIATLGINLEMVAPHTQPNRAGGPTIPTGNEVPKLRIKSFTDGSLAQSSGLQLGDEIRQYDGVAALNPGEVDEMRNHWRIGQTIQVTVRRNGADIVVPVITVYNPALRFNQTKEIRWNEPVADSDVLVFQGSRPPVSAFAVAEYADWECPTASEEEVKQYMISAAANNGANGILILNNQEEVKNFNPNADNRIGFVCALLIVPSARIGVEFETGTGYENRRIVRRVLSSDAESAGLRIGDNVLAIDGLDLVLNASDEIRDQMKWKIGQEVQLSVARDGKELKIPIKLVNNQP